MTGEAAFESSPEQERKVLKERAAELARPCDSGDAGGETITVIEFDLAGERYAIELARVREVARLKELTPVPCTPSFVLGIVNVRGEIRTVIDLKTFFDLPPQGITELNRLVMIRGDDLEVGVLADTIGGIRRLPLDTIQPTPPTVTGPRGAYLRGVTSDGVGIIDVAKLFSDPALLVNEKP
ncbi:MAG: chemotaxis protein CheW [Chthoniobacteraceae bacterium]